MTTAESALAPELRTACSGRLARLRSSMGQRGADSLLVSNPKDIRYLTGSPGHDCLLLVTADAAFIITDSRYDEALAPWRGGELAEIVIGTRHQLDKAVIDLLKKHSLRRLGVQAEHMTVAWRGKLADGLGDSTLVNTTGLVGKLRQCKDQIEIAAIEHAIDIHQRAAHAALEQLRVGMSEIEFCALLEYEMKSRGAEGPSFGTMVSSSPRSSVIHYQTSRRPIEPGVLLLDWGAVFDGYCSDMTRTFGIGEMPAKIRELYTIVLDAQQKAIDAIAPGKTCAEIDAIARQHITRAGYGEHFGHGLGHGVGLDIHEDPFFNNLSVDVRLEPGMVMTVEPGIYLPGVGGVRIEDDVLVTDGGCRVLTSFSKALDAAMIEPSQHAAISAAGVRR